MSRFEKIKTQLPQTDCVNEVPKSSVRRLFLLIGDYWMQLILRSLFLGDIHYKDIQASTGICHSTLGKRLNTLQHTGIVERLGGRSRKAEGYKLTKAGFGLLDFSLMGRLWQLQNVPGAKVVSLVHRTCGSAKGYRMVCRHCRLPITYDQVIRAKGPGSGMEPSIPARYYRNMSSFGGSLRKLRTLDFVPAAFTDLRSIQVLGALMAGRTSYNNILSYTQLSPSIVTGRLKWLESMGLVNRQPVAEGRKRLEYFLTDKGKNLWPSVVAAMYWGDRWLDDGSGPPVILTHSVCGRKLKYAILCDGCDGEISPTSLKIGRNANP